MKPLSIAISQVTQLLAWANFALAKDSRLVHALLGVSCLLKALAAWLCFTVSLCAIVLAKSEFVMSNPWDYAVMWLFPLPMAILGIALWRVAVQLFSAAAQLNQARAL